jgi:RNA polymerase sigma-70 factor (ECF subfamily)
MTDPTAVGRSIELASGTSPGANAGIVRSLSLTEDVGVPTDAELMARVASGDQLAFATVYDRHAQVLYGAVMRYLGDSAASEDVLQETFLTVWTRSESYAAEAGSLIAWLLTIARNRAIDRLRATSRKPMTVGFATGSSAGEEDDLERLLSTGRPVGSADAAEEPSDFAERRWIRAVVRTAVQEMPEPERRALELAYDDGLTQAEIAERLGWPIGTVKTRTKRALLRLREMLESVPDLRPTPGLAPAGANWRSPEGRRHGPR